jgi:hypothetical protein
LLLGEAFPTIAVVVGCILSYLATGVRIMLSTAMLLVTSMVVGQPETGRDSLNELGAIFLGDWSGQTKSPFDLEGVCRKGDKIDILRSTEWVLDKLALVRKSTYQIDGKQVAQGVSLITWIAPKKQIRAFYTDSIGSTIQSTWRKRGDSWVCQDRGVAGDGRKLSSRVVVKFDEEGDRYTAITTERILGGEELPETKITYSRVK